VRGPILMRVIQPCLRGIVGSRHQEDISRSLTTREGPRRMAGSLASPIGPWAFTARMSLIYVGASYRANVVGGSALGVAIADGFRRRQSFISW